MGEQLKPGEETASAPEKKYRGYEPRATELVLEIQAETDENRSAEKTDELLSLIYPKLLQTARRCAGSSQEAEDVLNDQIIKHLMGGRKGIPNRKGTGVYKQYIYEYQPHYRQGKATDTEDCFCGYVCGMMKFYLTRSYRENGDVTREGRKTFDAETQRDKTVYSYVRKTVSLDQIRQDTEGDGYEAGDAAIQASLQSAKDLEEAAAHELRQKADAALVREIGNIYCRFFDGVNALDENASGPRAVHERGILSYHMAFPYRYLKAAKPAKTRTKAETGADSDSGGDFDAEHAPAFWSRSFLDLAKKTWQEPLRCAVAKQNAIYQGILASELDFLSRLQQRVMRKNIGDEAYLASESDITNKANGWCETIANRVKPAFDALPEQMEKAREEIYNAIC